ncbi:MAG TPA: diacylglycerol kinase family protein [Anaerohalosphaeraceae bacterium]|nr:diacylglycerol kinase family protein [Anaerohalosphaeraceae bacterium]
MMKPQDGYIQYIVNPKSGASSSKRMVSQFRDYLSEKGFDVRVQFTASLTHAGQLAAEAAADEGCMLVAGAGGDGTLREVVQGRKGTGKLFLPVPCGTENLLANELGFDQHLQTLINAFEGNCIKPLDLGMINGCCFTSIVGFGFDGSVVDRISKIRTGHINHLTYFWPIWRTFWEYSFPPVRVSVDGKEIFCNRGLVFVGNISHYAIGLGICKKADYSDGLLDVCIFPCHDQAHLLAYAFKTALKTHLKSRSTIYVRAKTIQVSDCGQPVLCEIDGDPGPSLPADIHILPQAVRVIVPPGAKPAGIRTRFRRIID